MLPNDGETFLAPTVRLLVVAPDVVGRRMAGPGMRYVAIARALAPHATVTLAIGVEGSELIDLSDSSVQVASYQSRTELEKLVDEHDVIFSQFIDTNVVSHALGNGKRIVYDLYNALPVETVGAERVSGFTDEIDKDREYKELLKYFRFCSQTGSFFVTSNERQRDYWLGFIMANGGILPSDLGHRTVDEIIGLAPFGMNESDPVQTRHALRGNFGIATDDFVIVWAGGIWDWFDAETPIRAVAELAPNHPEVKLVFYGTVHPNTAVGRPKAVDRARELAGELGVLGSNVIFLDEWVDADDRVNYLLDADVALSAHKLSLETHYAFRTRILDHFWASLPSIVSAGDWFAEYIEANGLGQVTGIGSVPDTKAAILSYLTDPELRAATELRIRMVRPEWTWEQTTAQLRSAVIDNYDDLAQRTSPHLNAAAPSSVPFARESPRLGRLRRTAAWSLLSRIYRGVKRRVSSH